MNVSSRTSDGFNVGRSGYGHGCGSITGVGGGATGGGGVGFGGGVLGLQHLAIQYA